MKLTVTLLNLGLYDRDPWPEQPSGLRAIALDYFTEMRGLVSSLMQIFALALDLPSEFFDAKTDKPEVILRLTNYPPVNFVSRQYGTGEHTDYGTLTILWSNDSTGLQVKNSYGEWIDIYAPPESFIINIGDLMMRWTNGH